MTNPTKPQNSGSMTLSVKSFLSTVAILLSLMMLAGVLTQVLPQGTYERTVSEAGYEMIVDGSYHVLDNADKLPVWRWFTAPVEMLGDAQALTAIVIIVFILLVGGTFAILEKAGVFRCLIAVTIKRFGDKKYVLLCLVTLLCMMLGSTIGLFEETVPLVPILVLLALALGWDTLTGIGMSLMAVGFGFAAGTFNPFTVVVAQKMAELPLFSGLWLRLITFAVVYGMLCCFLVRHAKKVERDPASSPTFANDEARRATLTVSAEDELAGNAKVWRAVKVFGASIALLFAYVFTALMVPALSDYTMVVMAVLLTAGGLIAGKVSGYTKKGMMKDFLSGMLSMAPGALLILLSMSVRHIMEAGGIMDTILYYAHRLLSGLTPHAAALAVYAIVLFLQFFISSAASKAFLILPLIVPLADMVGISRQSVVFAFCCGDGFTNVFFPTNALLLIVLGMTGVSYFKWFKWTWLLQLAALVVTALILLFAVQVGYA